MSVVFFGTPQFAVPSLKALLEAGERVEAVVTQKDKRRGRGGGITPSPVKELALEEGIRILEPASMKDEAFIAELGGINPEFLIVVAYGRILSQAVLDAPQIAPVNLHASLLPKYRGASPIAWAIMNGEKVTGLTTMFITMPLDEGDIILQEEIEILEDDTTGSLAGRLAEAGGPLLVRTVKGLRDGTLEGIRQHGEASYAPMLKKEDGRVDWSLSATGIYNRFRGMQPWPGSFSFINGKRVSLCRLSPQEGEGEPGRIVRLAGSAMVVGTGDGLVAIEELQPENKKPMSARAFMQGRGIRKGARFK